MGPMCCVSVHGSAVKMGPVCCVSVHGSAIQMGPVCCLFQYTVQLVKDSSVQHLKEVLARKTGVQTSNVSPLAAVGADGPLKYEQAFSKLADFVCERAKH